MNSYVYKLPFTASMVADMSSFTDLAQQYPFKILKKVVFTDDKL
jgi:hypothetical protein